MPRASKLISIVFIGLTACTDTNEVAPASPTVRSASTRAVVTSAGNQFLVFPDETSFGQTMDQLDDLAPGETVNSHLAAWEAQYSFTSLRAASTTAAASSYTISASTKPSKGSTQLVPIEDGTPPSDPYADLEPVDSVTPIQDDFLAAALSKDQTIQIGTRIFRVDMTNQKVFYIPSYRTDLYSQLIATPNNDAIRYYYTNESVFDLIKSGDLGTSSRALRADIGLGSGVGCGYSAKRQKDASTQFYSSNQRLDCKVVYEKAGIYFSLLAKAQNQKRVLGIYWAQKACVTISPDMGATWLEKCFNVGNGDSFYHSNDCDDNKVIKRYYQSTRGLSKYELGVRFNIGNFATRRFYIIG